jgi:2-keto-3-deoxy-L-rhamnonate aldolase RhmA
MTRLQRAIKEKKDGPLLGAGAYSNDPVFLEIVAGLGYHVVWFDMEHSPFTFSQTCDLCRTASGLGLLSMIRVPDARRENVLRAAECGPDIIDLPMANSAEILHQLIRYARFRPEGERGCFPASRAARYGLGDSLSEQERINRDLCLMAQIETEEAVSRAEEICAVPGIDILIGPADLSSSLGVPYQTGHPKFVDAARQIIRAVRAHGKNAAVASAAADFRFWIELGVDLLLCANNVGCMRTGAQLALQQVRAARDTVKPPVVA